MNKLTVFVLMGIMILTGLGLVPALDTQQAEAQKRCPPNPNSACPFSPGHGGIPPGQTDNPSTNAPGHSKRVP